LPAVRLVSEAGDAVKNPLRVAPPSLDPQLTMYVTLGFPPVAPGVNATDTDVLLFVTTRAVGGDGGADTQNAAVVVAAPTPAAFVAATVQV
jgi:hypothetical protein